MAVSKRVEKPGLEDDSETPDGDNAGPTTSQMSKKSRALRKGRYKSKRRGNITATNNRDPRRD